MGNDEEHGRSRSDVPRDGYRKEWESPEGAFPRCGNFPVLKMVVLEFNP